NNPVPSIDPHDVVQVAGRFALNCWVAFATVDAELGVMESGEEIATLADALEPLPSVAVPVTVHFDCANGATKFPYPSILPQVDAQFVGAVAVKTCVAPSVTVGFVGEIV